MLISKTTFLEFQMCPKNTWLKLHRPEFLHKFSLSEFELHLVEQGNEVEAFARNLWPGGVLVALGGDEGCRETERLMSSGVSAIFQATFAVDGFIAKCDVLVVTIRFKIREHRAHMCNQVLACGVRTVMVITAQPQVAL